MHCYVVTREEEGTILLDDDETFACFNNKEAAEMYADVINPGIVKKAKLTIIEDNINIQ